MPGEVKVEIGCNYEDFLRGLATVKKEADLAVLEQRKKDQAARDERRAAERADRDAKRDALNAEREQARNTAKDEREQQRKAESERRQAAREELRIKKEAEKEYERQFKELEKAEKEAARAVARAKNEEEKKAESEKQNQIRNERSQMEAVLRETQRQIKEKQRAENEAAKEADRQKEEASRRQKKNADAQLREEQRQIKEKQRLEKEAQRATEGQKQQNIGIAQGFLSGGLSGGISAIGQRFGPIGMLAAEAINQLIEGFKKAVEEAKQLRNLSYATDITTGELRKLQIVAEQSGISLSQLAHSVSEFNKNMGKARIGGSELNNVLNKLGVSQEDVASGAYDYNRAMRDLMKAHKAGTDAATLAYYGNIMFGSSFEQMLPLIKKGTGDFDRSMQGIYKTSEMATSELANVSDQWEKFWSNFKNVAAEGFAFLSLGFNFKENASTIAGAALLAKGGELGKSAFAISQLEGGSEMKMLLGKKVASMANLGKEDKEAYLKALDTMVNGEAGVKLTPLSLQTAQAASQLQQMGGGDIVSAYAFNPSEETAKNTAKIAELNQQQLDEQKRSNEKTNLPKGNLYRSK